MGSANKRRKQREGWEHKWNESKCSTKLERGSLSSKFYCKSIISPQPKPQFQYNRITPQFLSPLTNFHYPSTKQTQSIRPYVVWAFKNTSWRAYPTLWLISYHIAVIMTTVYKGLTTVKTSVIWRIKTSVVTPQYLNSAGFLVNYKTGTIDYHRMSANQYYQTRKQCIN